MVPQLDRENERVKPIFGKIVDELEANGPLTANEISKILERERRKYTPRSTGRRSVSPSQVSSCLAVLCRMGKVVNLGKTKELHPVPGYQPWIRVVCLYEAQNNE